MHAMTGKGSNHIARANRIDRIEGVARKQPYALMARLLRQAHRGIKRNTCVGSGVS